MLDLIKDIRQNRNTKYYDLIVEYLDVIHNTSTQPIPTTVSDILRETHISRPTFYSYYNDAEEFYVDLMEIIALVIPEQMKRKSEELSGPELMQLGFEMKLGVILSNMKKISVLFPKVLDPWNEYFNHSVNKMGFWYTQTKNITVQEGQTIARMVLNELILHEELYYSNFDRYTSLILD